MNIYISFSLFQTANALSGMFLNGSRDSFVCMSSCATDTASLSAPFFTAELALLSSTPSIITAKELVYEASDEGISSTICEKRRSACSCTDGFAL